MAYMLAADEKLVENWKKRGWRDEVDLEKGSAPLTHHPVSLLNPQLFRGLSSKSEARAGLGCTPSPAPNSPLLLPSQEMGSRSGNKAKPFSAL